MRIMKILFKELITPFLSAAILIASLEFVAATNFQLSGRVTDQAGNGLSGALVEVVDPGSGASIASATTDSTGHYTLTVPGGTYNIKVTPAVGSGFGPSIAMNESIT